MNGIPYDTVTKIVRHLEGGRATLSTLMKAIGESKESTLQACKWAVREGYISTGRPTSNYYTLKVIK